jgi:hypothetical protein
LLRSRAERNGKEGGGGDDKNHSLTNNTAAAHPCLLGLCLIPSFCSASTNAARDSTERSGRRPRGGWLVSSSATRPSPPAASSSAGRLTRDRTKLSSARESHPARTSRMRARSRERPPPTRARAWEADRVTPRCLEIAAAAASSAAALPSASGLPRGRMLLLP